MWRFLFGAVVLIIFYKAPVQCDVKTLQHCDNEEVRKISNLKTKTKSELGLLLEMKHTEIDITHAEFLENSLGLQRILDELKLVNQFYLENMNNYEQHIKEAEIIQKLLD